MSCIVLPSLKDEEVVASVARLFEEGICSGCLCASDLGFVPVFRLNTQRVWRVVVESVLRLIVTPPVRAGIGWRFGCSALRIVEWRSGEGCVPSGLAKRILF